ncbi:hypothetical protein AWC38_SpisGene1229 [Stylophora pistillata]|uniref:Uncharacterized protein n=1 Tax=Stylophora pistillata TaxID=50429 RepID=A0A2B4SVF1_STYPI|nr:hypothetical protein AWC38_SpisGene1229 [Stylophora pistillata]
MVNCSKVLGTAKFTVHWLPDEYSMSQRFRTVDSFISSVPGPDCSKILEGSMGKVNRLSLVVTGQEMITYPKTTS